ncbi:hypothetical protein EYZ11_004818 [Aspergillus tanneri]|uniref:Uncharacterized protein n=1 Tax=Aspergillus tanneri TaxID=1220188 RepID=A0A4S3JJJ9_9EURO|nr:uncharacterized protein ATNIH1004_007957 [Aspergillus tanneri]KAA8646524.1 hypothetical protein ATNIH1004_007957 [Aspergillus tanneri]THC95696.1 hypothetical protein EYZ11_004818 [Aspergillus tanneri]
MKFAWIVAAFSATAWAAAAHEKRETATATGKDVNWSALGNAIKSLSLSLPTKTANLENIDPPPRSLIPEIVSALPPSALAALVVPAQRASLASDFKAGKTPDWYTSLPTDVQSYLSTVRNQIADGALTAAPKKAAPTKPEEASATKTGDAASSTSEGAAAAAAQPTGLVLGGMGALGVLGVALAL